MKNLKNRILLIGILILIGVSLSIMATVVMRNNLKDGNTKITLQSMVSENEDKGNYLAKDEEMQQYINVQIEQKGKIVKNVTVPVGGNQSS